MIELHPDLEITTAQAEQLLGAWLGKSVICSDIVELKGGLVNTVLRLDFDRPPHHAVVKLHGSGSDTFAAEARSLEYLRVETSLPVPAVYLHDGSTDLIPHAFLLLEHVAGSCLDGVDLRPTERADIDAQLADVLGELHTHRGFGWGAVDTVDETRTWVELFTERLAGVRGQSAVAKRLAPEVLARVDDAIELAPPALADSGSPTLVHGDIWDGNIMVRRVDDRWRIVGFLDPDLQFADVDYELAYLEVFDAERDEFFASYTRHHAVRPGYEDRRLFYWLHTALLHVALFDDEFFREFTARTADRICGRADP